MGFSVIFDMDGVIFDTERLLYDAWQELAQREAIPDVQQVYFECIGVNRQTAIKTILDHYGQDFPLAEYEKQIKEYCKIHTVSGIPQKKGVLPLLQYLSNRGINTGLASSTRSTTVRSQLGQAGLLGYFNQVVGGDMVSRSKPEPDVFLECAGRMGVPPQEVYVIEDSQNGIRAAAAAGMHPIMVPDLIQPDESISALCHRIFPSLTEVLEYIKQIEK